MIRTDDRYLRAMARLSAHDMARPLPDLAAALRLCAYREGRRSGATAFRSFPTPMDAALARLRAVRASHAALFRPEAFEPHAAVGPAGLNGVDVGPEALRAFALRHEARAGAAFARGEAEGFEAWIGDAAALAPVDTADFEDRHLRLRFLAILDPAAHAALVSDDPARERAAGLVADWWADRLGAAPPRAAAAFRDRLRDSVALTGVEEVDVEYACDAWIGEALDEADLPAHTFEAWRKSVAWINPRRGLVLARAGLGGEVETVGAYADGAGADPEPAVAAAAVPGPLDVAAFLVCASVPGAILRRLPGGLAVGLPRAGATGDPICLFLSEIPGGLRAVDDGTALARAAEAGPEWRATFAEAGLGWDAVAGEVRLDLAGLDGIGARLVAMAEAIARATRAPRRGAA